MALRVVLALIHFNLVLASQWPYTRTYRNGTVPQDEHDDEIPNLFIGWIRYVTFQKAKLNPDSLI